MTLASRNRGMGLSVHVVVTPIGLMILIAQNSSGAMRLSIRLRFIDDKVLPWASQYFDLHQEIFSRVSIVIRLHQTPHTKASSDIL